MEEVGFHVKRQKDVPLVNVRRWAVVGPSGSGKTTFATQLAAILKLSVLELDSVHHLPDWRANDENVARRQIADFLSRHQRWIIDGNYARYRDVYWNHVEAVVWFDLSRPRVMASLIGRSLRRQWRREELWNGNRERVRDVWSLDPNRSVLTSTWVNHARYRREYRELMARERSESRRWMRVHSRSEASALLERAG